MFISERLCGGGGMGHTANRSKEQYKVAELMFHGDTQNVEVNDIGLNLY